MIVTSKDNSYQVAKVITNTHTGEVIPEHTTTAKRLRRFKRNPKDKYLSKRFK